MVVIAVFVETCIFLLPAIPRLLHIEHRAAWYPKLYSASVAMWLPNLCMLDTIGILEYSNIPISQYSRIIWGNRLKGDAITCSDGIQCPQNASKGDKYDLK